MPPQLAYFGAVSAVLVLIWLAQGGHALDDAPQQHSAMPGSAGDSGGGGDSVAAGKSPYSYTTGEQPSPDSSSPYGGTTDNSSSSDDPGVGATLQTPGGGVGGSGIRPAGGGIGIGGVTQPSAPVADAITASTSGDGGYTGGYIPLGGNYVPATSSAGGGGSTRI